MKSDPLDVALRHIAETKHLLESLIISSESFDYAAAKLALRELQRKTRQLGKLQGNWQKTAAQRAPNIRVLEFEKPPKKASAQRS